VKNITFRADEHLLEAARKRALAAHTTLNEEFSRWLEGYARNQHTLQGYDAAMSALAGQFRMGRKLTRDDVNER
jgi:hypothetical protein